MRNISIVSALLFISISSMCQEMFISSDTAFERQTGNWYYSEVVFVDSSFTKDLLYQKARQWFSESFVSAKAVIDNADKEEGVIYGKGQIPMAKDLDGYVGFNIEIRCKNYRVKYTLSGFVHKDAWVISALGSKVTGAFGGQLDFGPLTQPESPYSYNKSGRNRDKFWTGVKSQTKMAVFNMIQSFKSYMNKSAIKEKDSW